MTKVRIVTDSTSCLPAELIEEYGIRVAPVGFVIDGKHYRDQVDITTAEFWELFPNLKEQPSTTAASPGDFVDIFTELSESTDSIVCILVSRVLSATQESAYLARRLVKQDHPNLRIEIIDSKTAAGAMGFIALEAARAAQQGKSLEEVLEIIEDMIPRVVYLAALETLKYLAKIGRAPRGTSVGEMLKVKPIIGFVDDTGLLDLVARVRGRDKSLAKLVDLMGEYIEADSPVHAMVHYSEANEDIDKLREMVSSRYDCVEMYVAEFSPVMVGAVGPIVGLSFYT
ncbi:DegV family protein [Chloroflexota bacterium]